MLFKGDQCLRYDLPLMLPGTPTTLADAWEGLEEAGGEFTSGIDVAVPDPEGGHGFLMRGEHFTAGSIPGCVIDRQISEIETTWPKLIRIFHAGYLYHKTYKDKLARIHIATGTSTPVNAGFVYGPHQFALSPDEKILLAGAAECYDTFSGDLLGSASDPVPSGGGVAFSSDGDQCYYFSSRSQGEKDLSLVVAAAGDMSPLHTIHLPDLFRSSMFLGPFVASAPGGRAVILVVKLREGSVTLDFSLAIAETSTEQLSVKEYFSLDQVQPYNSYPKEMAVAPDGSYAQVLYTYPVVIRLNA